MSIHAILLLLVILAAVFFRFYNTPARYGFDYDPVRDALIVDYAAKTFQLPLVGAPSGIGPFTFGPWYYYQLVLFKIIFPVAYSPWIYVGTLSVLTVFIMYKIGALLNGKNLGLILALLTALSPAETGQIRALSNPTIVPFYTTLTIWIFLKFMKKDSPSWMVVLWGLVLGIGMNNHYQVLGLIPLPIIYFIYKREKRWTKVLSFIIGLFISFLPLLVFNFFHKWSTVTGLIYYVTKGSAGVYIPNRWLSYVVDFWPTFLAYVLGLPQNQGLYIGLLMGSVILYLFLKRKISTSYIFLLITFILNFFVLRFFPGQRECYYLLYLHPFIFMFFGLVVWYVLRQKKRIIRVLILALALIVLAGMTQNSINRLATAKDQQEFKKEASIIMDNYPNKKFALYECADSQKNKIRGIAFFLNNEDKLSENGVKIVFPTKKCTLSEKNESPIKYLKNIKAIDVTHLSDSQLTKYGLQRVTPGTVYNQLTRQIR